MVCTWCSGCDGCCVFYLYCEAWSCRCSCIVMQMLYVCVLCASCGSSQCCVLHDLQIVNAGRGDNNIRDNITFTTTDIPSTINTHNIELQMVKVHINNTKHITIANIYIPPRDTTSTHSGTRTLMTTEDN